MVHETNAPLSSEPDEVIWVGIAEMAAGCFGHDGPRERARLNRLMYDSRPEERPPTFYVSGLGNCLRKSAWLAWLKEREANPQRRRPERPPEPLQKRRLARRR
jgi:hypothetical protein